MSFHFITHDGPKVSKDPAVRTLIRKQAMKDVSIARRKRGDHGKKVNLRQLPVREHTGVPIGSDSDGNPGLTDSSTSISSNGEFSSNSHELVVHSRATNARSRGHSEKLGLEDTMVQLKLGSYTLSTNYENIRSKFGIDIVDLSLLTSFNLGKNNAGVLLETGRLASLLNRNHWTFLEHVPSRYGESECLTATTNCLLAKVHSVLVPELKETYYILYQQLLGRALESLQKAISDGSGCMSADVLGAAQMMSLHELLNASPDSAWTQHVNGTARLIRYRTPSRFCSEFEKSLLANHAGAIISYCLMADQHCYLEEAEWRGLFRSFVKETAFLDDRHKLAIDCRASMFELPGLWHDTSKALNSDALFAINGLTDLEARARESHQCYIDWLEEYKLYCVRTSLTNPTDKELALRRELFGSMLECLSISKRILAAICDADRFVLEAEAQAIAHLLMNLQKTTTVKHSWLFTSHEIEVSSNIIFTKDSWEEDVSEKSQYEQRLAVRARFNMFSNTLRMGG